MADFTIMLDGGGSWLVGQAARYRMARRLMVRLGVELDTALGLVDAEAQALAVTLSVSGGEIYNRLARRRPV